jgi:hypothetical protein
LFELTQVAVTPAGADGNDPAAASPALDPAKGVIHVVADAGPAHR